MGFAEIAILSFFLVDIILYGISAALYKKIRGIKKLITPICIFGSVLIGSFFTMSIENYLLKGFIVMMFFFVGGLVSMLLSLSWSKK